MPATFTQVEEFPAGTPEAIVKEEQRLRITAGAITSEYDGSQSEGWKLTTTWNVLGEQ
jgi:hypothetical protein